MRDSNKTIKIMEDFEDDDDDNISPEVHDTERRRDPSNMK